MCVMLKVRAHDRLGYRPQHRGRRSLRSRYGSDYSRAWSRWNYSNSYQPSYDSSDEWVDYDYPEYYATEYYGWRPWTYSGRPDV